MTECVNHADWMQLAIDQAKRAQNRGEVPIGAIIVLNEQLVVATHNQKEDPPNPCGHAEILALQAAAQKTTALALK